MKVCRDCKEEKELSGFVQNKLSKEGIDTLCIECNRKRVREWRRRNPELRKEQAKRENGKDYTVNKHLKHTYGISLDMYNAMFEEQQGRCYICQKHQVEFKKRLCVDHNHQTGKIRALLCPHCNYLLGHSKEDTKILQSAIEYLDYFE